MNTPNDIVALVTLTGGGLSGPMRVVNRLKAVTIDRHVFAPFMFTVDLDQTETGQHIVLHAGTRLLGLIPEARALQMRLDLAHNTELPDHPVLLLVFCDARRSYRERTHETRKTTI